MVRSAARRFLRTAGYSVVEASDGRTALEKVMERHLEIDLVVLDLTMPGMTWRECLEQLRAAAPHLPVLLSSGYASSPDMGALGPTLHFLPRPYTRAAFLEKLTSMPESRARGTTRAELVGERLRDPTAESI
jgi:CheY-like chemotaxis protein